MPSHVLARSVRATGCSAFRGLSAFGLALSGAGSVRVLECGGGRLWSVVSPAANIGFTPAGGPGDDSFFVLFQRQGAIAPRQCGRAGHLGAGELCLLDGRHPFELTVTAEPAAVDFLQVPRETVLSRHPYLEFNTVETLDPHDAGTVLLMQALRVLIDQSVRLTQEQSQDALLCIVQLLGVPPSPPKGRQKGAGWRVRAALAQIEAELSSPLLTAEQVARLQGISRRRLDKLLVEAIGVPAARHIVVRRIERAADNLIHPQFARRTIRQVAYEAGFDDAAHFTRAFKRHFLRTPQQWREANGRDGNAAVPRR